MYTLGLGGDVGRGGGVQVSNYNVCMSHRWWCGGSALYAVEGWVGDCCGGVETLVQTLREATPQVIPYMFRTNNRSSSGGYFCTRCINEVCSD